MSAAVRTADVVLSENALSIIYKADGELKRQQRNGQQAELQLRNATFARDWHARLRGARDVLDASANRSKPVTVCKDMLDERIADIERALADLLAHAQLGDHVTTPEQSELVASVATAQKRKRDADADASRTAKRRLQTPVSDDEDADPNGPPIPAGSGSRVDVIDVDDLTNDEVMTVTVGAGEQSKDKQPVTNSAPSISTPTPATSFSGTTLKPSSSGSASPARPTLTRNKNIATWVQNTAPNSFHVHNTFQSRTRDIFEACAKQNELQPDDIEGLDVVQLVVDATTDDPEPVISALFKMENMHSARHVSIEREGIQARRELARLEMVCEGMRQTISRSDRRAKQEGQTCKFYGDAALQLQGMENL